MEEVKAWLKEARLEQLGTLLEELGVESLEDLKEVREEDLENNVKTIPLRRFLEKQRALIVPLQSVRETSVAEVEDTPSSPVSSVEHAQDFDQTFEWSMVGGHQEAEISADADPLDSWEFFETSLPHSDARLKAKKAVTMEIPHFTLDDTDEPKFEGNQKMSARPVLWKLRPEEGWMFLTMQFPGAKDKGRLKRLVDRYKPGFSHAGRMYFYASSSKGTFPHGPTAWLASPPHGGPEQIDKHLGFGSSLVLEPQSAEIPFPVFRLRARVKQLFSSLSASIDLHENAIEIIEIPDFTTGQPLVIRDDGAGEADPDILTALASASGTLQEDVGLCRSVTQSAQIRCEGLKGMLIGSKRLQGSGRVEVPRNMRKFGTKTLAGQHLHVLNFSKIRPTSLGRDLVLRLQACGCDATVFVEEQQRYLKRIGNCNMSREDAIDCLRFAQHSADDDEGSSTQSGGMRFLGTFLRMLQSGFSPEQHPLLEVVLRQKEKSLERAKKQIHVRGCWSARGHPEPGPANDLDLEGDEVFLMVPSDEEESGWKALTGEVIINYLSDRDPYALRRAIAKDSKALRAKCVPGVLFFSKAGEPLQANLSWDFDGDYFQVITHEKLVKSFAADTSALPLPDFETASQRAVQIHSLVDVHAHFLAEYLPKDQMGILHWKWQILAGKDPSAASSPEAREAAAAYCKSLDVEKGKPCPVFRRWVNQEQKWDFMNKGDPKNCSPTATGECFRQAASAHDEFVKTKKPMSRGLDPDLQKVWAKLEDELGSEKCEELAKIAHEVRGKLVEGIKEQCKQAERRACTNNPFTTSNDEIAAQQWITALRSETEQKAQEKGLLLAQVALAGWHLKYVSQGVHQREADPDPSFPWMLFGQELLVHKEYQQPCLQRELRQCHTLLRRLQKAAGQAAEDADKEAKLQEAIRNLKSKCHMKCHDCSKGMKELLEKLHLDGRAADIMEATRVGAGKQEQVDCQQLRFAKECIPDLIENGPEAGTKLQDLVEKLVKGEVRVEHLVVTAVRFHGELYVVEGNRRLWCIQQAQKELQKPLTVSVLVSDLFLGFVRRQDHREPALPYFLDRFDSKCKGQTIQVVGAASVQKQASAVQVPLSPDSLACPKCGGQVVHRTNSQDHSEFWGCRNYPTCRGTINISTAARAAEGQLPMHVPATAQAVHSGQANRVPPQCPSCSRGMVQRNNRDTGNPFWGCTGFPKHCKITLPISA